MSSPIYGYKKLRDGYIAKLQILGENNQGRSSIKRENERFATYRCKHALVLAIYKHPNKNDNSTTVRVGTSLYDKEFIYTVGQVVTVNNYEYDKLKTNTYGIHYFLDETVAKNYTAHDEIKNDGLVRNYYADGELHSEYTIINGKYCGDYTTYKINGDAISSMKYKNGVQYEEPGWIMQGVKDGVKLTLLFGTYECTKYVLWYGLDYFFKK